MKKTGKILALILVAGMLLSVLGGCQQKNKTAKNTDDLYKKATTLTMMVFQQTAEYQTDVDTMAQVFPDIAKNVKVNIVLGGGSDADIATKFRLLLASNQDLPDCLRMNYTQVPEFAYANALAEITPYIAPYKSNIQTGALEVMQYKGKYVAYPYEVKSKLWYYRTDIFAGAGVDPLKVKSVDDFIAAGKAVQAKYPGTFIENYGTPSVQYDLYMMMLAYDGNMCDDKGNYQINTNPGVKKAFETLKKLHDSGVVSTNIVDFTTDYTNALKSGVIVSQLVGNWFKKNLPGYAPDQYGKWAAAPWPQDIAAGSEAGGGVFVIPQDSKNKEVMGDYLSKMMFDEKMCHPMFDKLNKLQYTKTAVGDSYLNNNNYFGPSLASVDYKAIQSLKVYNYNPAASQEQKIVLPYLDSYLSGKISLDQALTGAQNDCKSQIGNPYKS